MMSKGAYYNEVVLVQKVYQIGGAPELRLFASRHLGRLLRLLVLCRQVRSRPVFGASVAELFTCAWKTYKFGECLLSM